MELTVSTIKPDSIIVASQDQVSGELTDGETVVLNLKDGVYYGLDSVGSEILKLIQEPKTVQAVRDILLQHYDVEPEVCERDLVALLTEMADKDLIRVT